MASKHYDFELRANLFNDITNGMRTVYDYIDGSYVNIVDSMNGTTHHKNTRSLSSLATFRHAVFNDLFNLQSCSSSF